MPAGALTTSDFIGVSASIVRLRSYVSKIAKTESTVLITGETGTGKEHIAHALHRGSTRFGRAFVSLNCAALPDTLLESELFGYERGAFTGATVSYPGKLRLGDGGTVFLDEVGDLSLTAQAKLLRVIECREVFPIGGKKAVPVDVRFVAATNRDLNEAIHDHGFRQDLFYRLNVVTVSVPPLRQRPEDIAPLVTHFVNEMNRRTGHRVTGIAASLLECFAAHGWPGNVRELRNLVEAIFVDPPSGALSFEHLPDHYQALFARYVRNEGAEKERLISTLHATNWNKTRAAAQLHWSRMTLYRKLRLYGIGSSAAEASGVSEDVLLHPAVTEAGDDAGPIRIEQ